MRDLDSGEHLGIFLEELGMLAQILGYVFGAEFNIFHVGAIS
jgi:hypothetical protein